MDVDRSATRGLNVEMCIPGVRCTLGVWESRGVFSRGLQTHYSKQRQVSDSLKKSPPDLRAAAGPGGPSTQDTLDMGKV